MADRPSQGEEGPPDYGQILVTLDSKLTDGAGSEIACGELEPAD